jgi:hypothetical protein
MFVICNSSYLTTSFSVHSIQMSITDSEIKAFNKLLLDIKIALNKYLITHVFYYVDEILTFR